jgi:hypothetical protein
MQIFHLGVYCLVLVSLVCAQQGSQEGEPLYNINSKFDPVTGSLFYEILDQNAITLQRIEEYYPVPPSTICS